MAIIVCIAVLNPTSSDDNGDGGYKNGTEDYDYGGNGFFDYDYDYEYEYEYEYYY